MGQQQRTLGHTASLVVSTVFLKIFKRLRKQNINRLGA